MIIILLRNWWQMKVQRIKCALGQHTRAIGTAQLLDYSIFERLRLDSKWVCESCMRELGSLHPLVLEAKARVAEENRKIEQKADLT